MTISEDCGNYAAAVPAVITTASPQILLSQSYPGFTMEPLLTVIPLLRHETYSLMSYRGLAMKLTL
jgi:hypothetical protein